MNVYKQIAGSIIRWGLTIFFAYLVRKGIVSESDAIIWVPEMAIGILGLLAPLAWSFWQKLQARLEFLMAQKLPVSATTADVQEAVAIAKTDLTIVEQVKVAVAPEEKVAVI